jgi:hypothetical protein
MPASQPSHFRRQPYPACSAMLWLPQSPRATHPPASTVTPPPQPSTPTHAQPPTQSQPPLPLTSVIHRLPHHPRHAARVAVCLRQRLGVAQHPPDGPLLHTRQRQQAVPHINCSTAGRGAWGAWGAMKCIKWNNDSCEECTESGWV